MADSIAQISQNHPDFEVATKANELLGDARVPNPKPQDSSDEEYRKTVPILNTYDTDRGTELITGIENETKDSLTKLANEKGIANGVSRLVSEVLRGDKEKLLVIKADIRYFKAYDDLFSWSQGDDCLKELSTMLSDGSVLRQDTVVGRLGGDDFIVAMTLSENDYEELVGNNGNGHSAVDRLLKAGQELHNKRGQKDSVKFKEIVSTDPSRVLHALRLADSDLASLNWDDLGMMTLNLSSAVFSTGDLAAMSIGLDLNKYEDRSKLWETQINNVVDDAVKVVKAIDTKNSRAALCDRKQKIIKTFVA